MNRSVDNFSYVNDRSLDFIGLLTLSSDKADSVLSTTYALNLKYLNYTRISADRQARFSSQSLHDINRSRTSDLGMVNRLSEKRKCFWQGTGVCACEVCRRGRG